MMLSLITPLQLRLATARRKRACRSCRYFIDAAAISIILFALHMLSRHGASLRTALDYRRLKYFAV